MLYYFKTYCLNNLHLVVHDVCIFNCKMTALLFHVINRFVLLYICPAIDHCWHQNVWRTKTWHKVQSSVPWMCLPHFEVGTHQSVCIIQFIIDPCVFTSLQLSSRIFLIGVKFHCNSCRCSDTWLTEEPQLTVILAQNSYFSNSWLNFLLSTRLITTQ